MGKAITLTGTVRTFEWTNPRSWLWVYFTEIDGKPATDKDGNPQVWCLEGVAPGEFMRQGINNKSLKPGDKISVTAHPLKDGLTGGSLGKIMFANGQVLGTDTGSSGMSAGPTHAP